MLFPPQRLRLSPFRRDGPKKAVFGFLSWLLFSFFFFLWGASFWKIAVFPSPVDPFSSCVPFTRYLFFAEKIFRFSPFFFFFFCTPVRIFPLSFSGFCVAKKGRPLCAFPSGSTTAPLPPPRPFKRRGLPRPTSSLFFFLLTPGTRLAFS